MRNEYRINRDNGVVYVDVIPDLGAMGGVNTPPIDVLGPFDTVEEAQNAIAEHRDNPEG